MSEIETVTVDELKENLTDYLERAESGELFVVMEGGRSVAELAAPVRVRFEKLVEEGKLKLPRSSSGTLPEPLPGDPDDPYELSRALEEVRDDR